MNDRVKKPEIPETPKPEKRLRVTSLAETATSAELTSVRKRYSISTLGDLFQDMYEQTGQETKDSGTVVQPMYDPSTLYYVASTTPVMPLVDAMQTNIEKTGHTIISTEPDADPSDAEQAEGDRAKALFAAPYPGVSMLDIRKEIRGDLEIVGYSGLRVIRNLAGEIAFLKHVPARNLRVIKSKKEHKETVTVERPPLTSASLPVVRRRFVVMSGTTKEYLREFGATRKLNRKTGKWSEETPAEQAADDLIFFTLKSIPGSPYGAPRWLSAVINALGARDADEQNLELLKSGGVPHTLITLVGGMLSNESREQLENHFSSEGNKRGRVAIVEVANLGGTLDGKETPAKVEVSKFGSADLNDSMFREYIQYCTARVQHAFRLGGVFLGIVADANRSNAEAQYLAGEQQVFHPERQDFDAKIDSTIMAEIAPKFNYRSNALTYSAMQSKLDALELIRENADPASLIQEINNIAATNVQMGEAPPDPAPGDGDGDGTATVTASASCGHDHGALSPSDLVVTKDTPTPHSFVSPMSTELPRVQILLKAFVSPKGIDADELAAALEDTDAVYFACATLYDVDPDDSPVFLDCVRLFEKQVQLPA